MSSTKDLKLESVIGFNGFVPNGLQYTPCGNYLIYPLGSILVLRSVKDLRKYSFFDAETDQKVSCFAISKDGNYVASGHEVKGSIGGNSNKAMAFLWDLKKAILNCEETNKKERQGQQQQQQEQLLIHPLEQHTGKVESIDFNCDTTYLVTLGGKDDNDLVIWNVLSGEKICGSPAATEDTHCVKWLHNRNDRFVSCGELYLRVWQVSLPQQKQQQKQQNNPSSTSTSSQSIKKMHAVNANMGGGMMRRSMQCLSISQDDSYAYAGSTTGEVLMFRIDRDDMHKPFNEPDVHVPALKGYNQTKRFSQGVRSVACIINPSTGNTNILVGAGDGTIQILNPKLQFIQTHKAKLNGAVTSIALSPSSSSNNNKNKNGFFAGTDLSQMYHVDISSFQPELHGTCHFGEINDIRFPKGCPDIFMTCSLEDIRIWNTKQKTELLRIRVPNMTCHAIDIHSNGSTIISAWSDGKIRAFLPESGKLKFIIPDAHSDGVTALTICNDNNNKKDNNNDDDDWNIVSGGKDGRVRVWNIRPISSHQKMIHSMKEHRGTVNAVKCNVNGTQAISASSDGSCIIWDIQQGIRIKALYDPTRFNDVLLHPDESQYLSCGANCKISYWDAFDGSAIRVIEGGHDDMTCLDIQQGGDDDDDEDDDEKLFVSGSADKLVKLWTYNDGQVVGVGKGHSGTINRVAFSPDEKKIISVGSEGGIFVWNLSR